MLIHGNDGSADSAESRIPHKVPKRILHFSDGTLEEYSTDEESLDGDPEENTVQVSTIDPSSMSWGPWVYYQTATAGSKALAACDYMGEALANFFGILSSKYQYEIDEFNRQSEQDKEIQKRNDLESGGWMENPHMSDNTLSQQPTKITV